MSGPRHQLRDDEGRFARSAGAAVAEPDPAAPASDKDAGLYWDDRLAVVEMVRHTRAAGGEAPAAGATEEVSYDVVISTENPVMTPYGEQVLGHGEGEVDLRHARNGISLLLEHGGPNAPYRVDPDYHAGLITNLRVEGGKLKGLATFGSEPRAQRAEKDFAAGKRPFLSVGWIKGPKFDVVPVSVRGGKAERLKLVGWSPVEGSIISVPVDFNSRKGRGNTGWFTEGDAPIKEERSMRKVRNAETGAIEEAPDTDPRPNAVEVSAGGGQRSSTEVQTLARSESRAETNQRASQIVKICGQFGVQTRAAEFIESDLTVADICDKILEGQNAGDGRTVRSQPAVEHLKPTIPGLTAKDASEWNYLRALRCATERKWDGAEGSVHNALQKKFGITLRSEHSVLVPMRVAELTDGELNQRMEQDREPRQMRALGSGMTTGGATLVTSQQGEFIDLLRNDTVCMRLGAQSIPGLVGTIEFPKQTSDPTVNRMGENPASPGAPSSGAYDWVLGSPKTYIGVNVIPRQLINLTSFDVEANERNAMVAQHGIKLDRDGLYGGGAAHEPLGVYRNTDTQTLAMGGVPTYKKLIKMLAMAKKKNFTSSQLAFITTTLMEAELACTLKAANVHDFIWEDGDGDAGRIGRRPAVSSNQMSEEHSGRVPTGGSEHGLICGAFQNLKFLYWGVLEITVDQITLADKGQLKVVSFLMGDVVNVRPEGFVVATGATVTA